MDNSTHTLAPSTSGDRLALQIREALGPLNADELPVVELVRRLAAERATSEAQVPVAATLDDAATDPALTLDVARELLRDAAAGIRSLAASATPRTEPAEGRELLIDTGHGKVLGELMARIFGSCDKQLTESESRAIQALHAAQIALAAPPPAGDGALNEFRERLLNTLNLVHNEGFMGLESETAAIADRLITTLPALLAGDGVRELYAHLLDMLGAKDHEDAARIIAQHHVREIQDGDGARVTEAELCAFAKNNDDALRLAGMIRDDVRLGDYRRAIVGFVNAFLAARDAQGGSHA